MNSVDREKLVDMTLCNSVDKNECGYRLKARHVVKGKLFCTTSHCMYITTLSSIMYVFLHLHVNTYV